VRIAINGFGRIGTACCCELAWAGSDGMGVVGVNDVTDAATLVRLHASESLS
jgi:glyceraldehyde-3-phosphate dehydrogenase/erythrose-4-phosphate dehydrogenase